MYMILIDVLVYFHSLYQSLVSADGGYVWTTSTNVGKQITSESKKNSCTGSRKRDFRKRGGAVNS